jgi:hypothetical protein
MKSRAEQHLERLEKKVISWDYARALPPMTNHGQGPDRPLPTEALLRSSAFSQIETIVEKILKEHEKVYHDYSFQVVVPQCPRNQFKNY